jgi:hypothetical protein
MDGRTDRVIPIYPPNFVCGGIIRINILTDYLQMCMKEYGCCPKFKRGDNSTYTFTKRRDACTL